MKKNYFKSDADKQCNMTFSRANNPTNSTNTDTNMKNKLGTVCAPS